MRVHKNVFKCLAKQLLCASAKCHAFRTVKHRTFSAYFNLQCHQIARLWNKLCHSMPHEMSEMKPVHLLYALHFMKLYQTSDVNSAFAGLDAKTVRKYTWKMIDILADVDWVSKL